MEMSSTQSRMTFEPIAGNARKSGISAHLFETAVVCKPITVTGRFNCSKNLLWRHRADSRREGWVEQI